MVASKDRRHPPLLQGHTMSEVRRKRVPRPPERAKDFVQQAMRVKTAQWRAPLRSMLIPRMFVDSVHAHHILKKFSPAVVRLRRIALDCLLERPAVRRIFLCTGSPSIACFT